MSLRVRTDGRLLWTRQWTVWSTIRKWIELNYQNHVPHSLTIIIISHFVSVRPCVSQWRELFLLSSTIANRGGPSTSAVTVRIPQPFCITSLNRNSPDSMRSICALDLRSTTSIFYRRSNTRRPLFENNITCFESTT